MVLKYTFNKCWFLSLLQAVLILHLLISVAVLEALLDIKVRLSEFALLSILGIAILLYIIDLICTRNIIGQIYIDENKIILYEGQELRGEYSIDNLSKIVCNVGDYYSYLPYFSILPLLGNNTYISFKVNDKVYNLRIILEDRKEKIELIKICEKITEQKKVGLIERLLYIFLFTRLF